MIRHIAILGSTGSIGRNALRVVDALGPDYQITALSAHSNVQLLAQQARRYKPRFVAVTNVDCVEPFCQLAGDLDVEILAGSEGMTHIAQLDDVDTVLTAVVGAAGLPAVLAAAKEGKRLAIANKEPLVIAGELLRKVTKSNGASILPVDSEHSAVFQAMQSGRRHEVDRIILTASGGPFRQASAEDIQDVTLEQALAHPESIVHSLVEFVDGSVIAQLGEPDMCLPIQYALTHPARVAGIARRLRLEEMGKLTFEKPNPETFRALPLAYEVARTGGTAAVVFNAANEAAVEEFLAGRIRFVNIIELIERCLDKHEARPAASLEELLEADAWARSQVTEVTHNV